MNERNQLVSIIVRTKDRVSLLKRALQSIAAQTYRPVEVILVNDGGGDLNIEEISGILGDRPLKYIHFEKNRGRASAANEGIENAEGRYIGFLDDDDELYPSHVSLLTPILEQNKYKVAYSDCLIVYEEYDGNMKKIKDVKQELFFSKDFDYGSLVFENYIPFMCLLFDRQVLLNSGGLDNDLTVYEDWDLLIRLGETLPFYHIRETTAHYYQWSHELQISQRNHDRDFLKKAYLRVISKHRDKINPERIYNYVSECIIEKNSLRNELEMYRPAKELWETEKKDLEAKIQGLEMIRQNLELNILELEMIRQNLEVKTDNLDLIRQNLENTIQTMINTKGWQLLEKYRSMRNYIRSLVL